MFVGTGRGGDDAVATGHGHVLVLDNERTLDGEIDHIGDQYRVRRPQGELWVPATNVLQVFENNLAAYEYLRKHANLRDPDERLRLAGWCHGHGLRKEAVTEATAAVELRPDHAESRRLLQRLERALGLSAELKAGKQPDEAESNLTSAEVSTQSLSLFVTRVQPLLMNACASCHATGRGGNFKLVRIYDVNLDNRRTMQANLAAVVQQINKEQPILSPLLAKAVTAHGDMLQAPLKGRDCAPYRSLDEWVRVTLQDSPQMKLASIASANGDGSPSAPELNAKKSIPDGFAAVQASAAGEVVQAVSSKTVDPYDPSVFNKQVHPEKNPEANKP
jgi:hypothetical protein